MATSKNAKPKSSRNKIKLLPNEFVTVGIDVHKQSFSVALFSTTRLTIVADWVQSASHLVLIRKLEPIREQISLIIYEAGPCGYSLARDLIDHRFNTKIVSPAHLPRSAATAPKTDRLDAIKLAEQAASPYCLKFVTIPTVLEELDRQVFRSRELVMRSVRKSKAHIKSLLLQHHIEQPDGLAHWSHKAIEELKTMQLQPQLRISLNIELTSLELYLEQRKDLTNEIKRMSRLPRYSQIVDRMIAMPGIGILTAMAYLLELYQLDRFQNKNQLARMVGLAPGIHSSGQTVRQGRVNKDGKNYLKPFLVEAAWRWIRKDADAAERFMHLFKNTSSKKKAVTAMARRLAIIFWVLGTNPDKTYDSSLLRPPSTEMAA